ncbi:right-handed parallel beta-helix repeat-containing protein [Streptomyces sp. NBC_01142]|uniref:right-handed parallel beta-helix repeat-containing protein n=1 Tax=Streptomyces sp. NBC_01142 TaxID=2975865 RepID=UPI002255D5BA|nr:right-handed parallel beta-helix repeat-containing protein [Streptomyces sp. NBC_01142]MCX4820093.1 right-handed parallel beta-helix repeat-containing protein [Streptomyces sp. NBC_01142]
MTKRQITSLACAAVAIASGLGAAAPSTGAVPHVVHPGESIQKAVDAARPGDTIFVAPGTYRESVLVTKANLTLRGAGSSTVIKPASATARAANTCAKSGNGICVTGTAKKAVSRVTIRSLTLTGFKKSGVWASATDRLTVTGVTAKKNGVWGIAQQLSTRGVFRNNIVRDNGDAAIFIANTVDKEGGATDTKGAVVAGNLLSGNRIGVTIRRVRNLSVHNNIVTANCAGVFVVGDESKPAAGDMTIHHNRVFKNNKYCAANSRLPYLQGSGIVLTGSESTLVRANQVLDNVGASPLSGGIVLFKSFVGASNTDNVIRDNQVQGNKPADLANQGNGTSNTFVRNECLASKPAGMC